MMLKPSSSRNFRAGRGYKVKHVAQMCLILAVSSWMLYQLRHCNYRKSALEDTGIVDQEKAQAVAKLGRKWLLPGVEGEAKEDEEAKGAGEERGDEFEQVDDLMEETDEQEMDDKEQENQSEDDVAAERFTKRNESEIMRH